MAEITVRQETPSLHELCGKDACGLDALARSRFLALLLRRHEIPYRGLQTRSKDEGTFKRRV
jgi:hypothetical protein